MKQIATLRFAKEMLSVRDHIYIVCSILVQCLLSILDIVGVGFVSLVVYVGMNPTSYLENSFLSSLFNIFPFLVSKDSGILLTKLVVVACCLFISKSLIAPILLRMFFFRMSSLSTSVSRDFLKEILSGSYSWMKRQKSQELIYILGDGVNNAVSMGIGSLIIFISEIFLLIAFGILLTFANWKLTFILFIFFGCVVIVINQLATRKQEEITKKRISSIQCRNNVFIESLSAFREIRLQNKVESRIEKFSIFRSEENDSIARLQFMNLIPKYSMELAMIFGALIISLIMITAPSDSRDFAIVTLYIGAATRILPSILRIQSALGGLNIAKANIAVVQQFQFKMLENSKRSLSAIASTNEMKFDLCVKNLDFTYPGSEISTVSDLSFNVPFGKTLAIVGKTGSGKSTLLDLLLGELIPNAGSITYGKLSPEQLVLRNSGIIGLVPQEIPLFNASILENIILSREDDIYVRENVSKMILRVELGELVRSLPMGIDTVIGESGVTLSGGQVQRIGLARALYTSPKVLILDEATSALDAGTEDLIIRMLHSLEFTVSKIIVAHRLSSIKNADQIVFMDEGKVLGVGTFEDLRKNFADFDNQAKLMGL